MTGQGPLAFFGGRLATGLCDIVDPTVDPDALRSGWWALAATFEGAITAYRFAHVRRAPRPPARTWPGAAGWSSSLDRAGYLAGVARIREHIATGRVYQVNLCRLLSAPLAAGADPLALAELLAAGNPSPYQAVLVTEDEWIVTASPELFLSWDGTHLRSAPVKGTAPVGVPFADKDFPENIMITDLVRHDLGRIAEAGSVRVEALTAAEEHPGLRHLVSTVRARPRPDTGWPEWLAATFPPGSVSGAPKHTALQIIRELEPVPRGIYCGAVGFVDAERNTARLAVGIRTFFTSGAATRLHFGTGAGITWSSDPAAEWAETELKAATLLALAAG